MFIAMNNVLHSQKEYNEWVLGYKLDFSFNTETTNPIILDRYFLYSFELDKILPTITHSILNFENGIIQRSMPSVICNQNGELLYYSYANILYNHEMREVENSKGLQTGELDIFNHNNINFSRWICPLQSSMLLRIDNIFIRLGNDPKTGFSYTIFDSENGVLKKNQKFALNTITESFFAVKNFENENYWIIIYNNKNSEYLIYELTKQGVINIPNDKYKLNSQIYNCLESRLIKASPNGEYIINLLENRCEDGSESLFELLRFDPINGKIIDIEFQKFANTIRNAEFSISSNNLYIVENHIFQYNLLLKKINEIPSLYHNAMMMQLGPNGKIYFGDRRLMTFKFDDGNGTALDGQFDYDVSKLNYHIYEISNPKDYFENLKVFRTIPPTKGALMHNFPNIPTSAYLKLYTPTVLRACVGDSVQLRAIAQYHNFPDTNYVWTGPNGFYSEEQNPILMDLSPADEGVYKVKVFGGETIDSGETYVQVFPTPEPRIEAHPSTFSCDGEAITLVADEDYGSYLWSTGETTKSIEVSEAGEYYLTIEDENACIGSTSIAVGFGGDIFILGDTLICQGESTILSAGDDFTEYLWSTGETTKSIEVSEAGKYTLKIKTEEGCEAEASINVSYHPEVIAELRSHEQELCYGESVDLVSRYDLPHWEMRWSTGEEGKEIKVIESGLYKLYIEDLETGCKDSTETQIWIEEEITAGIQGANICEGEETELIAEPQGEDYSYVWSTGETTSSIKVIESGNYSVKISKGKCESEAEIEIEVYPMPELAIVGEREICQGETTILSANEDYESYEWSTGERTKSIEAKGGEYSLRVWTEDGCSITESVIVKEKSSEIEFESLVYDFGKVYLTETRDTIIEGRNISENDIIIETQIINPEDYYRIDYSLNPQTTGPYREIIELRVEEPCPRTYQIELLAEIYTRVKLSAPELEVEIGESDLRIPYYIESETNLGEKNFTAQVEISKEVYHTEDPYTVIKSHNIQIDKTEFHSQTGIVLLASLEEYPISFSNINFEDPYIEIEEDPGLLILNEICIHDARLIELIEPTKAYVSPNPAGESLKVRIESEERGEIEIELLDASGMRVYAQRLTNSRAEINIPTKSFSSGVYILKINTARAHLEKRIMIVR